MPTPARPRVLLICPGNLDGRETDLAQKWATQSDLLAAVPGPLGAHGTPANTRVIFLDALSLIPSTQRPDFIVYASPPATALHWKVWRWKRVHANGARLGGYGTPGTGGWSAWLARETLDFILPEDLENPAAFLVQRQAAEACSVLWVEEDISLHSPSTKHLVSSLPQLREEGWTVRAWCLTADAAAADGCDVRRFPAPPRRLGFLTPYWFLALANGYGLLRRLLDGRPPAGIIQTVGGAYLGADIAAIQFINHVWLRKQLELGVRSRKAVIMFLWTLLGAAKDQLQFSNPRCRLFLPASDSIATEVRRWCLARAKVETLPNSYDETRFNPDVRRRKREPMRQKLGFTAETPVFCFTSQGHYERKGFWLAVEALSRLRQRQTPPSARALKFLVVGGQASTLQRLQAQLAARYPGWESWIVFVGNQAAVEDFFAAADAFLFPSYFEAFCLAEIEAGALGLPLLLTPHQGTEMILRPGENGLSLPFNAGGIEAALDHFLQSGLPPFTPSAGRALNRREYARALADIYGRFVEPGNHLHP